MAGHGGGAWKVAYADFVTAMMAFFLVMWITAQNKPVKHAIAAYFEDPMGTSSEPRAGEWEGRDGAAIIGPAESGNGTIRGIAKAQVKAPPDAKNKGVANRPNRTYLSIRGNQTRIGTIVMFAGDSAELDAAARAQLDIFIPQVLGKPNKIEIRGHSSRRPMPGESAVEDPWQLCYARCLATMNFLIQEGVKPARIRLSQAGTFEPSGRDAEEGEDPNSRVEVFAVSEFATDVQ
jgi:chemotaxis protein MotB